MISISLMNFSFYEQCTGWVGCEETLGPVGMWGAMSGGGTGALRSVAMRAVLGSDIIQ